MRGEWPAENSAQLGAGSFRLPITAVAPKSRNSAPFVKVGPLDESGTRTVPLSHCDSVVSGGRDPRLCPD